MNIVVASVVYVNVIHVVLLIKENYHCAFYCTRTRCHTHMTPYWVV
jgi:hypothetical protein